MVNEPQKNQPDGLVKNPIVDDGKFEKMKNHESQPETIKKNMKTHEGQPETIKENMKTYENTLKIMKTNQKL